MQVRYQAALRPDVDHFIMLAEGTTSNARLAWRSGAGAERLDDADDLASDRGQIDLARLRTRGLPAAAARRAFVQPVARAADGEPLLVQEIAYAADQQHFVVLVVAPVAAPLDRFELREFLLPVAQNVRLDTAQFAHLADGEVAFRRNRRQATAAAVAFHDWPFPPMPSASGWRGR